MPKPASKPVAHATSHPTNHSGAAHRELRPRGAHKERAPAAAAAPAPPPTSLAHLLVAVLEFAALLACLALPAADGGPACARAAIALAAIFAVEAAMHVVAPAAHVSVGLMVMVAVVFTINPVEEATAGVPLTLHMGTVPPLCAAWLGAVGLFGRGDYVRALYGSEALRPYHLVVMFLGSVYLCTALERSGFLHTAAVKVVDKYGRSPWGLFWALAVFSGTMTVLIPDDIVTMTLTPITLRMCQLLNLPEIPFLFSQFFAGNIWAVTLVTGNPTNVLLAEDLGDTFTSFAGRMGWPGIAAGLTSFVLMWWTNRHKVDVVASDLKASEAAGEQLSPKGKGSSDAGDGGDDGDGDGGGGASGFGARTDEAESHTLEVGAFTARGVFCLIRVLGATLVCALESFHGYPVYLVVLIMGGASLVIDAACGPRFAMSVLQHMPWELFAFVTAFLVLAEAMALSGISLWMATIFLPLASSRRVAFVSGYVTMLFCNVFETLPATLVVFKMIDSVPQWSAEAIRAAGAAQGALLHDARRAALSAVIFGSNFGANTSCIGSLGGLMMRRLAAQQGVKVTNGMLLKQGIPVMIPVMFVACLALIQQKTL